MVLGHSLKRTKSPHSRVCLYTDDVPSGFIRLLSALWDCRLIKHVSACTQQLSFQDDQPHRFDKVFTKLRVLSLVDFAKVLLMDIDLIVTDNIDELFELPAPAALRRGMNDSRWPLKTGDPIEGRPFFGGFCPGRDTSGNKWSWGQGTGINAGVMLLQPDMSTLNDMLAEISDPNHPSHARGNGPEQDYLSRYWADAPWRYLGVEYNFQLHQMFFALHPNWASNAERAEFFRSPEKIKVIHFSGVEAAKPWHRVLDQKFASYWPDRSRDADYTRSFADEFLGHWLWIRKDPATWDDLPNHHQRTEMQPLYRGEDGKIWRKDPHDDSAPSYLADVPEEAAKGAMTILSRALSIWFDCFEELEQSLGTDLKRDIAAIQSSKTSQVSDKTYQGTADTGGTQSSPASEPLEHSVESCRDHAAATPSFFKWTKAGGWWTEKSRDQYERLTVVCGAVAGRPFVSFCEGCEETFGEHDDEHLSGLFVKIAGRHCARHFPLPTQYSVQEEQALTSEEFAEELSSAVTSISIWVDGVPLKATVLVAIIGLPSSAVGPVLSALGPLGVPTLEGPSGDYHAFAAVGQRPDPPVAESVVVANSGQGWFGEKRGNARPNPRKPGEPQTWTAAHASRDIAYASIPLSIS